MYFIIKSVHGSSKLNFELNVLPTNELRSFHRERDHGYQYIFGTRLSMALMGLHSLRHYLQPQNQFQGGGEQADQCEKSSLQLLIDLELLNLGYEENYSIQ
jgi:hypothetical protein